MRASKGGNGNPANRVVLALALLLQSGGYLALTFQLPISVA